MYRSRKKLITAAVCVVLLYLLYIHLVPAGLRHVVGMTHLVPSDEHLVDDAVTHSDDLPEELRQDLMYADDNPWMVDQPNEPPQDTRDDDKDASMEGKQLLRSVDTRNETSITVGKELQSANTLTDKNGMTHNAHEALSVDFITNVTKTASSDESPDIFKTNALCDVGNTECIRFQKLLSNWPPDRPKAAIYYLTRRYRIVELAASLRSLYEHFLRTHPYPVIIFHEAEFSSVISLVRTYTPADLYFQEISLTEPSFLPRPVPEDIPCFSPISYRTMCRFHVKGVYQEPIMQGLEYYWRLDDDSSLRPPAPRYDVFRFMQEEGYEYGYRWKWWDATNCVTGLWNATRDFIKQHHIKPYFFERWREPRLYYNNFEISSLKVWTSPAYIAYANYLDKLGGIYYHRWGDAPIRGLAVSMFIPENRTHLFDDIGYIHGSFNEP